MKRLHLICNAHLDPIWQWTWDEGISAAIATFKSAADLAEEFDYVFCHGESLLYEAIEKNAPDLFKRIQKLVKAGKWHISGGWYLQPDCLMPCGETFVRQIAVGKEYFREKFGVEPTIATNYDSFGHSIGLVQIMAKNGYKGYLTMRPYRYSQREYPSRFFKWTAPDGSSILVSNSNSYNSALGDAIGKIKRYALEETDGTSDVDYVLWGVGNHGGGPSRKDLRDIAALEIEDTEILHSTPEALFADNVTVGGEVKESLVTCMPGCYSSMAKIKQGYRKTENLFYATEKMIAAATLAGANFDLRDFKEAEKKMLLATFHDILPGSCVEEGEREGLALLGASEKTLRDYRTQAFLYLVMNQPCAGEGEYPVFVFNYLPYSVKMPVEVEFSLADQNWSEESCFVPYIYDEAGNELTCQQIKEDSMLNLDWRKRIVFEGELKPLGITRFTVKTKESPIRKKFAQETCLEEKLKGNSILSKPLTLELYEDDADPWGMSDADLKGMGKNPVDFRLMTKEEAGDFCGVEEGMSPVRIVEDGNVYTAVEGLYTQGNTKAVLQYKLYKNQDYVDVKATVEFADKNKMVRLKVPMPEAFKTAAVVGDGPYISEEKPDCEISFQKWLGRKNGEEIFAVINDGVYAGKAENGYLYLTLLRGSGYCFHPILERDLYPRDRYLPRIDNGRYVYNIRLYKGTMYEVNAMAERFNQLPYAVNVFPTGGEKTNTSNVKVKGNVILSTMKVKGDSYILRVYNPATETVDCQAEMNGVSAQVRVSPCSVISLIFEENKWQVVCDKMPV